MKRNIADYATLVFDCDGVVLDSNKVKTNAFYQATLSFGEVAAEAMVAYHVRNGGISRYKKFAYFLEFIAPQYSSTMNHLGLNELLDLYAVHVKDGLMRCNIASGLEELREQTPEARWLIVSGGDQVELREVFKKRGIAKLFDGGIFGSPDPKDEILERESARGCIQVPALFIGDSRYDFEAATGAGLDFVFLSGWSEVSNWREWVKSNRLSYAHTLESLARQ